MSPRILLFAGAPEPTSLDWAQPGLIEDFSEPFIRFARLDARQHDLISTALPSASSPRPAWRSLPLEQQHLATGLSQNHGWEKEYQGASFFTTSDINSFLEEQPEIAVGESHASSHPAREVISQFYEQSYAIHEDITSPQVQVLESSGSFCTDKSFTTETSLNSSLQSFSRGKEIVNADHLNDLKDIPNAAYLNSIYPQTMTVNLIVGIISMHPPRKIKTHRGADVELVEVLLGDETKSGFKVNFWLSSSQPVEGDMRSVLGELRPQDVVFMKNVALSIYQGKVYGQSLRKEMTKCYLLYRNRVDRMDVRGFYRAADLEGGAEENVQLEKTSRVREWVLRFVGVGGRVGMGRRVGNGRVEAVQEALPPDTQ
jgi:hypothetical protein